MYLSCEFVLVNNLLKEYNNMKEEIKNLACVAKVSDCTRQFIKNFSLFIKQCYLIVGSVEKILKVKTQEL